jgi:transposase
LQLRKQSICTSTVLQRELAQEKQVELDTSTIRKVLGRQGFKWLPRAQKPKYDKNAKKARLKFANYILRMTVKKLREWLSFAMDGVILTIPPSTDDVARENYCRFGDTHMWRKPEESASPELAGDDPFGKQVPIGRAIPIWGGISEGGFSVVLHHPKKKVHATEWAEAVNKGKLTQAVKALRPVAHKGPWNILCDNESFLSTAICREAHAKHKIKLHHIPAKSPDLNPVERYWGWLRKQMRAKDLADLRAGRPVLGKTAYRQRLMRFLKTKKSQSIASGMAKGLRNVCKLVVQKKGAASGK